MKLSVSKDIEPLKVAAKKSVDDAAEATRLLVITPGSGQAMVYQRKFEQAQALITNPSIDDALIPAIINEIGITAPTKEGVAQVIMQMEGMWGPLADKIERARLSAKNAIDAATSPAEIETAKSIDWSSILSPTQ